MKKKDVLSVLTIKTETFTFPAGGAIIDIYKIKMNRPFKTTKVEFIHTYPDGISKHNHLVCGNMPTNCNYIAWSHPTKVETDNSEIKITGFRKNDVVEIYFKTTA